MLKNGFGAGRRSLQSIASIASTYSRHHRLSITAIAQTLSDKPFVCASCQQSRTYATRKTKGGKLKASAPFQSSIKRLETHVQYLETSFRDIKKMKAAERAQPGSEISEEMSDRVYKALMAEAPSVPLLQPPRPNILERLPEPVVERLAASSLSLATLEQDEWQHVLVALQSKEGFKNLSINQVNQTISCLPYNVTVENTTLIFKMIEEAGLQPRTMTYDFIMLANAALGQTTKVRELFMELKEMGCVPTVYSYAHLLRALSEEADVFAASAAFKEMQISKIAANLTIYTSLLNTCIKAGEISSAWQVFDLMKYSSTSTHPDLKTYSLMIHACALEGETERALNLLQELTEKGLVPSEQTYNALIHACAMRKDYFSQAWQYATEMQTKGFKMKTYTLNVLLIGCGKVGELTRARMLIRHMLAGGEDVQPDEQSFYALFRAYANYKPPFTKKASKEKAQSITKAPAAMQPIVPESFVSPPTHRPKGPADESISIIFSKKPPSFPFFPRSILPTHAETVQEAEGIYNHLRRHYPSVTSTHLTNTLLDIYLKQGYHETLQEAYNTLYAMRNIYTYYTALESAYETRHITFARQILADRIEHLSTASYRILSPAERHKFNFMFERLYINTLARCEFLEEAGKRLIQKREDFKHEWTVETLMTFRNKAVQLEDFAMIRLIEDVAKDGWREGEYEEQMQEVGGVVGWQTEANSVKVRSRRPTSNKRERKETYRIDQFTHEQDEEEELRESYW